MTAVKGEYAPVFVGKTWLGKYDEKGEFTAHDPNKIIGYYFFDFNEEAVREQREHHLDGSEEEVLDPIPHVVTETSALPCDLSSPWRLGGGDNPRPRMAAMIGSHIEIILIVTGAITAIALLQFIAPASVGSGTRDDYRHNRKSGSGPRHIRHILAHAFYRSGDRCWRLPHCAYLCPLSGGFLVQNARAHAGKLLAKGVVSTIKGPRQ
jgi:hypothetical protein